MRIKCHNSCCHRCDVGGCCCCCCGCCWRYRHIDFDLFFHYRIQRPNFIEKYTLSFLFQLPTHRHQHSASARMAYGTQMSWSVYSSVGFIHRFFFSPLCVRVLFAWDHHKCKWVVPIKQTDSQPQLQLLHTEIMKSGKKQIYSEMLLLFVIRMCARAFTHRIDWPCLPN